VKVPETQTAQTPVNEPLKPEPEPLESAPVSTPQPQTVTAPVFAEPQQNKISLARELLVKARNMIQFRKRKKLDRVMTLFLKKSKITNNEVKDFLHVSDATAERYLNILEKENKIKQVGKTGKAVSYSRI
jgi:predicted HTH transcriptional regulator